MKDLSSNTASRAASVWVGVFKGFCHALVITHDFQLHQHAIKEVYDITFIWVQIRH
jgi:ethanolamine utilization microcompartment shell protein EutS